MAAWSRQMTTLMPLTEKSADSPSEPTQALTKPGTRGAQLPKSSRP